MNKEFALCLNNGKEFKAYQKLLNNKEQIIINCSNVESVGKVVNAIQINLSTLCKVSQEQIENPKVKIIRIDNINNMDNKALEKDLNNRNFRNFTSKCTVFHSYKNPVGNLMIVILDTPADIFLYFCICCTPYASRLLRHLTHHRSVGGVSFTPP